VESRTLVGREFVSWLEDAYAVRLYHCIGVGWKRGHEWMHYKWSRLKEAWTFELIGDDSHTNTHDIDTYVFVRKELCTINCVAYANWRGCWRLKTM